jgi:hypothetical protein
MKPQLILVLSLCIASCGGQAPAKADQDFGVFKNEKSRKISMEDIVYQYDETEVPTYINIYDKNNFNSVVSLGDVVSSVRPKIIEENGSVFLYVRYNNDFPIGLSPAKFYRIKFSDKIETEICLHKFSEDFLRKYTKIQNMINSEEGDLSFVYTDHLLFNYVYGNSKMFKCLNFDHKSSYNAQEIFSEKKIINSPLQ